MFENLDTVITTNLGLDKKCSLIKYVDHMTKRIHKFTRERIAILNLNM